MRNRSSSPIAATDWYFVFVIEMEWPKYTALLRTRRNTLDPFLHNHLCFKNLSVPILSLWKQNRAHNPHMNICTTSIISLKKKLFLAPALLQYFRQIAVQSLRTCLYILFLFEELFDTKYNKVFFSVVKSIRATLIFIYICAFATSNLNR